MTGLSCWVLWSFVVYGSLRGILLNLATTASIQLLATVRVSVGGKASFFFFFFFFHMRRSLTDCGWGSGSDLRNWARRLSGERSISWLINNNIFLTDM